MKALPIEFANLPALKPPTNYDGHSLQDWTVIEDWVSPPLDGLRVYIAKGAKTDGASIPRAVWSIVGHPFSLPLLGPALIHDMLYSAELTANHAKADWLFLRYMQLAGIGWHKRNRVWLAVRLAGGLVWAGHTEASVAAARTFARRDK